MKFSHVLVHSIGFNFRCGGKLDLTSEGGHLGFFKMAAMKIINFRFFTNWTTDMCNSSFSTNFGSGNLILVLFTCRWSFGGIIKMAAMAAILKIHNSGDFERTGLDTCVIPLFRLKGQRIRFWCYFTGRWSFKGNINMCKSSVSSN